MGKVFSTLCFVVFFVSCGKIVLDSIPRVSSPSHGVVKIESPDVFIPSDPYPRLTYVQPILPKKLSDVSDHRP